MIRSLVLFFLLISFSCFSQHVKLSRYEKRWALAYPFAALKVKKITKRCYAVYNQGELRHRLDTFSNGGKLDAFRHTFFMAAYSQKIKVKKIRRLGIAHEKANYRQFLNVQKEEGEVPDSLSSVMDLSNNELGFTIGPRHKKASLDELKQLTLSAMETGKAMIIKRNRSGKYVDCESNEIDLTLFSKTWNVPKCLVPSD